MLKCDWCGSSNVRLASVHPERGGLVTAHICAACESVLIAKPIARRLPIAICFPAVTTYAGAK